MAHTKKRNDATFIKTLKKDITNLWCSEICSSTQQLGRVSSGCGHPLLEVLLKMVGMLNVKSMIMNAPCPQADLHCFPSSSSQVAFQPERIPSEYMLFQCSQLLIRGHFWKKHEWNTSTFGKTTGIIEELAKSDKTPCYTPLPWRNQERWWR